MIIYTKNDANNHSAIGRIETPIKMIIEHESDLLTKKGGICSTLFNVEKSSHFGETIIARRDFDVFQAAAEGEGAEIDTVYDVGKKFIEHVQFMKEFVITAEMMEDAENGVAAEAKRRAENFTRAYYKTINNICSLALGNGNNASIAYAKSNLDLTTFDGYPLFSKLHKVTVDGVSTEQSNNFWGNIFTAAGANGERVYSTEAFEAALCELSFKLRNMRSETGEPLGYIADTIILPGNRPMAEVITKKVCGTYGSLGSNLNDINVNFGNWNIVIMPTWTALNDTCLIMSSEANKSLSGNMFFNRVPLTVSSWVDHHTGNYIWNGRCRFGVGFGSYKHIIRATDSQTSVPGATQL